jgi:hypothetical protein
MLATACRAPPTRLGPVPAAAAERYTNRYGVSGRVRRLTRRAPRRAAAVRCGLLPVDSQSIASQLFAASLFPYLGFLYFVTRSKTAPGLTLFGFYFLLAFVGATSTRCLFSLPPSPRFPCFVPHAALNRSFCY